MKIIETKLYDNIEFAYINDHNYYKYLKEKNKSLEFPKCEWLYDEVNTIKFKFPMSDNSIIGDFIMGSFMPFCAISERVYKYLFIDNPEISSNLLTKKINLINDDTFQRKLNEDEVGQYYLIVPGKMFSENEKEKINGIAWCVEKTSYTINNEFFYHFELCISDNYAKDFKAQKFSGIAIKKYEKIEINQPENIYYESTETNVMKKISCYLQEVSKKKIVKSKCKYIYYTIIEEENGYTLGVSGYTNKYFDDETFSFEPNMCELTNTDFGKIDWKECITRLQKIIQEIYNKNNGDFYNIKAFIGFHDSEVLPIN